MQQMRLALVVMLAGAVLTAGGCQNWKGKYETCSVEQENLQALFDQAQMSLQQAQEDQQQCQADRANLSQQLTGARQDLQTAKTPKFERALEAEGGVYNPQTGTITVTLESNVLFDAGKVDLKSESKSRLDRIASILRNKYAGKRVSVVGHTDTDPINKSKWKDNWELSTQRSLAVTRYLIKRGVSAEQVEAVGRGEFHPVGASKAGNRRVEIEVYAR